MSDDEHIALGLRGGLTPAAKGPAAALTDIRPSLERLVTVFRDFAVALEVEDKGALRGVLEQCLQQITGANALTTMAAALDTCVATLAGIVAQSSERVSQHKQEVATLIEMVREALAIVAGDGEKFSQQLAPSMDRFEALVQIDDLQQLKQQLVAEVRTLRQIAAERQRAWDDTCEKFNARVASLEKQLNASTLEASLDPLTRIANRRTFERVCREWIKGAQPQFVIAFIDVDHFKTINDTHGHATGDQILKAVAQSLKGAVRNADLPARLGGDEFAVLVTGLTLQQMESRLRMVNAGLGTLGTQMSGIRLTLSCGVTEFAKGDTIEILSARADSALYEAKRLGRNRVVGKVKATPRVKTPDATRVDG